MLSILRKRKKVFISSTSVDLADWRERAAGVLRESGLHVLSMEDFPAMGKGAALGSGDMVRRCDLLVGIYARRYGTVGEGGRSITEHEYDEAKDRGLPRLCFMLRDGAAWPPELTEGEPGAGALQKFKQKVRGDVIVAEFSDLKELEAEVKSAADEYLQRESRRRRVRVASFLLGIVALTVAALTVKPTVRPEAATLALPLGGEWDLSRDRRLVVFQGEGPSVWQVERPFDQRMQLPNKLFDAAVSPNSNFVVGHTGGGDVYLHRRDQGYSAPAAPSLSGLKPGGFDHQWSVFSPDERWVAVCSADGRLFVWEAAGAAPDGSRPFLNLKLSRNSVYTVSPDIVFSKKGRWLGVVDDEGDVYLARLGGGAGPAEAAVFKSVADPEGDAVRPRLWFSEDEQWVAASDSNGTLTVWRLGERPPARTAAQTRPEQEWADRGEFTKDSKWVLIRPTRKGFFARRVGSPPDSPAQPVTTPDDYEGDTGGPVLWLSPDGQWAAGIIPGDSLHVWRTADLDSQNSISPAPALKEVSAEGVSFSPDGGWLAAVTESGGLYVWRPVAPPEPQSPAVQYSSHWDVGFVWCEDNRHFYTYGDQNLYLGEAGAKPELAHHDAGEIKDVTVVPDGSALIVLRLEEKTVSDYKTFPPKFKGVERTLHLTHVTRKLSLWGVGVKTLPWPRMSDKGLPER